MEIGERQIHLSKEQLVASVLSASAEQARELEKPFIE